MPAYRDPEIRFAEQFCIKDDGCFEWTGALHKRGYAHFAVRHERFRAHRWVYETYVGPIARGMVIDHLCRNKACVNPDHLEPVTQRENVLRGEGVAAKQLQRTRCPRGHEYNEENTRIYGRRRFCRQCDRDRRPRKRVRPESVTDCA